MRLGFAGTPELAQIVLTALLQDPKSEVVAVMTQPDKPVGRHRHSAQRPPVKMLAEESGVPVLQPETLSETAVAEWLAGLGVEAVVVAAYGKIVPETLLAIPARGFINVHASLLPRWRGAAPIQRAILAGDQDTGVCVMQMDAGLDTGPVWACEKLAIGVDETAGELTARLAEAGGRLLVGTLSAIESGDLPGPAAQDDSRATLAPKVHPEDVALAWSLTAAEIHRRVRAGNPKPGATVGTGPDVLKVWRTAAGASGESYSDTAPGARPGTVLSAVPELVVMAADGPVALLEVQPAGKGRMRGADFARGRRLAASGTL